MLDFLGAASFHDYFDRAARSYGVDLGTMQASTIADTSIARVAKPLLMLHALDDLYLLSQIRHGRHDGGAYSLAYRDTIREHPHVRALIVDRGDRVRLRKLQRRPDEGKSRPRFGGE